MTILGSARGAYTELPVYSNPGSASVSIDGFSASGALATSFSVDQRENFSVSQCLNGSTYLYAFGHDPSSSTCTIGYTGCLVNSSCQLDDALMGSVFGFYEQSRVSKSKRLIAANIGGNVVHGALISNESRVVDNKLQLVTSSFTLLLLDAVL